MKRYKNSYQIYRIGLLGAAIALIAASLLLQIDWLADRRSGAFCFRPVADRYILSLPRLRKSL